MALEPEDRTEDLVAGHRTDFVGVRKPKKQAGDCRMVVEFPFSFSKEFLRAQGEKNHTAYRDGVDYLRVLKWQFEQGEIDLGDLVLLMIEHGDNAIKIEAAK